MHYRSKKEQCESMQLDMKALGELLEMQVAEIKKDYLNEQELVKRLKMEMGAKSCDLEAIKNKARLLEQKQSVMDAGLNELNVMLEKEKKRNQKMRKEVTEKV